MIALLHSGQTPAESDYQLLEIARRLEMYGVRLHPAKDREGTKLSLSVAHTGVLVFQVNYSITASMFINCLRKSHLESKKVLEMINPVWLEQRYFSLVVCGYDPGLAAELKFLKFF